MKKIWKMRKDGKAVSPVIATILMVAITVVLAAVLYVMVMGFGGPSTQTPTGSFSVTERLTTTTEKVQFGVITPDTKVADIKIVITHNGTAWQSQNLAIGAMGTAISFTQLGGSVNKVASGDYLTVTPITGGPGTGVYSVSMIFIPTGNIIGAPISFNW
jgi:flagellin-like protein